MPTLAMATNDENEDIQWIEMSTPTEATSKEPNANKNTALAGKKNFNLQRNLDVHRGRMMLKGKKKLPMSRGQQRAEEIRQRKRDLFLKLLFTARTTLTPWIDVQDVKDVHQAIYRSIRFEKKKFAESEYGKRLIIVGNNQEDAMQSIDSLTFAANKLSAWMLRCHTISRSQIIMSHLIALESILNVLLEEFKFCNDDSPQNGSKLLALYSMAVINFCNALTSYPTEYNIDITVRNCAELFECPGWIVNCRHTVSHPSPNPPTMGILAEAIAFALDWMDRFFWSKAMCEPFTEPSVNDSAGTSKETGSQILRNAASPQKATGTPISNSNSTLNFGPPKPGAAKEQIHHQTCLLLFTSCPNNRAAIKKDIQQYMLLSPNEYIRSFAEILTFGVPIHETLSLDGYSLPSLLLRRSSRIFGLVFSSLPADQMLILLLNMLIDLIASTESMCDQQLDDPNLEYHQRARHSGRCWLSAIIGALTVGIDIHGQPVRRTIFQKSFDFFGDLAALKRRHTFVWLRMLYRICQLQLHDNSAYIVRQFYHLIDQDVMSPEKHQLILDMITVATGEAKASNPVLTQVKTINDLKNVILDTDTTTTTTNQTRWTIPIGASLSRPDVSAIVAENLKLADNQDKYMLENQENEDANGDGGDKKVTEDVDMITID